MIGRFFKRLLRQRDQHQDDVEAAVPTDQAVNGARNVIQDSPKNFYRFRSSDALIGERAELLNQEIYFADLRQLNDPMEGSKDVFWRGDSILWSNLIKHYLLCVELAVTQATYLGKDTEIKLEKLVLNTTLALPTQAFRDIHREVCEEFFKNSDVAALPVLLGQRRDPIRRDELFFYLTGIQSHAFLCVISCLQRHNLFPPSQLPSDGTVPSTLPLALQFIRALSRQDPDHREVEIAQRLFQLTSQVRHRTHIAIRRDETKAENVWWNSLMFSFPESYILALDSLLFTEWYTACFVTDPHQAAMWGNYGDGHRGVCLKFRASRDQSDRPSLNLRRITGWGSGPKGQSVHYDYVPHEFVPVYYEDRFPEVDFFKSLGRTPVPALNQDWFSDGNGSFSPIMREIHENEESWRKDYCLRFDKITRTKLADWEYEKEHRLILASGRGGFEDPKDRKLQYRFEDLEGIIFGMKTSIDDRVKIIGLIEEKCKQSGRTEFEFLQAYYSRESGRIETHSLFMNETELKRPIGDGL